MKVKEINIKWEPADIPSLYIAYDGLDIKGALFRGGEVVASLPLKGIRMQATSSVTLAPFLPSERTVWTLAEAIEADAIHVDVYDNEVAHTLVIEGKKFVLEAGVNNAWTSYDFSFPSRLPLLVGGIVVSLTSLAIIMGKAGRKLRG